MESKGRPIYREWSPWPGWLVVIFWGAIFVSMAFVALDPGETDGERVVALVILAAVSVAIQWLVAGLSVRLYRDHLMVGLGSSGWISKRIDYTDIVRTESVTYRPIAEFGGWGVRWGKDRKKAWTARGNHAVVLHLEDGTRLYVGSDRPHRLEERIRAVAGTRIGAERPDQEPR